MFRCISLATRQKGNLCLWRRPLSSVSGKLLNPEVEKNRSYSEKEGFVWKSGYEPISVPEMTIDEYVWKNVAKWEDKLAIVSTYSQ